jgi:hypothetical protein
LDDINPNLEANKYFLKILLQMINKEARTHVYTLGNEIVKPENEASMLKMESTSVD